MSNYGGNSRYGYGAKSGSPGRAVNMRVSSTNQNTFGQKTGTDSMKKSASPKPSSTQPNIEIIENRLYWISSSRPPQSYQDAYFFSVDQELVYDPFNNDFGPLNLAMVHKFVRELIRLLSDPTYKDYKLFHYCSNKYDK